MFAWCFEIIEEKIEYSRKNFFWLLMMNVTLATQRREKRGTRLPRFPHIACTSTVYSAAGAASFAAARFSALAFASALPRFSASFAIFFDMSN